MTDQEKLLVQDTWEKVKPISGQAAEIFYARLFELDPTLRPLFTGNMKEQGIKLMQMIGMAVSGLKNLETLIPIVQDLGRRHIGYGVKDEHYETVGSSLIWTLSKGLEADFTPEVEAAWGKTYETLATVMREAAAESQA